MLVNWHWLGELVCWLHLIFISYHWLERKFFSSVLQSLLFGCQECVCSMNIKFIMILYGWQMFLQSFSGFLFYFDHRVSANIRKSKKINIVHLIDWFLKNNNEINKRWKSIITSHTFRLFTDYQYQSTDIDCHRFLTIFINTRLYLLFRPWSECLVVFRLQTIIASCLASNSDTT